MRMPKLKLPSLGRKKGAATGSPAKTARPKKGGPSLALIAFLFILAGIAGVVSWLLVNSAATEEHIKARIPQVILPMPVRGPTGPASSIIPAEEKEMAEKEDDSDKANGQGGEMGSGSSNTGPDGAGKEMAATGQDSHGQAMDAADMEPEPERPEGALPKAPLAGLQEETDAGPLPKIGPDGTQPWEAYSRPFDDADQRPRIAIVITGLGLSRDVTLQAIETLPPAVTLSFSPYATDLAEWIDRARRSGHEALIDLPMEPETFPQDDPGPAALMTESAADINLNRLDWVMSRAPGFAGLMSSSGSRFLTFPTGLEPVMVALKERGLMFVDGRSTETSLAARSAAEKGVPRAYVNGPLDREIEAAAIEAELLKLVELAERTGYAVSRMEALPLSLAALTDAIPRIITDKVALAPVSALANKQTLLQ